MEPRSSAAADSSSERIPGAPLKNARPLRNCEITAWMNAPPGRVLNPRYFPYTARACVCTYACVTTIFTASLRRRVSTFGAQDERRENEESPSSRWIARNLEYFEYAWRNIGCHWIVIALDVSITSRRDAREALLSSLELVCTRISCPPATRRKGLVNVVRHTGEGEPTKKKSRTLEPIAPERVSCVT